MWIETDLAALDLRRPTGITIGAFDGVHRGHQALIRRMVMGARAAGNVPLVVTFDPLPGQVLQPEGYRLLSTLAERLVHFEVLGVEGVIVLDFDDALRATPADDFVQKLAGPAGMRALWVGPDFRLGSRQQGDVAYLEAAGRRLSFDVHVFRDIVRWGGAPVRSSRIRAALSKGDLAEANGCLGYAFHLCGEIVHGYQRGRGLGFPTANLAVSAARLLPANGVYLCRAHVAGETFDALTNVGTRPTFDNGLRTVEAYLLDFSNDIYGEAMQLVFLDRLRPETRFESVDGLVAQMRDDEVEARRLLRETDWLLLHEQPSCPASPST